MSKQANNTDVIALISRKINASLSEVELAIPDIHCAGCISTIENALSGTAGVEYARVNLTTRRVRIRWLTAMNTPALIDVINKAGFKANVPENLSQATAEDALTKHIRALAVAGFATANVMMLSLSVWSGADENTRHIFHLLSAMIVVPALIFSSRLFFVSAWQALRVGRTNMDVPICVGIVLTTVLSIYDTTLGGEQVYFDAVIMLVFLLLIGRTLETRMRAKARGAVDALAQLQPALALIYSKKSQQFVSTAVDKVIGGDILQLAKGERIPVDCKIISGRSSIDMSLVSGESVPVPVSEGDVLFSGCLNLESILQAAATDTVNTSFLGKIEQLIEDAGAHKGHYQQLADRVVSYYTPFVHMAALLGFMLWMWHSGDWHRATTVGVTVLIITCPCALGLAVPITRVIAAHQLIKIGVLMKDGAALERLATVAAVVFDKTGTLTTGQAKLYGVYNACTEESMRIAQSLCNGAEHPYAKAIVRHSQLHSNQAYPWQEWCEVAGNGVSARLGNDTYRLGRAAWALNDSASENDDQDDIFSHSLLTKNGFTIAEFTFEDCLRKDAPECINRLRKQCLAVEILSGDAVGPVRQVAAKLNIEQFHSAADPNKKLDQINLRQSANRQVLMVGDGINDGPALAASSVSMVPGTGADMTRKLADFVLLSNHLTAIPDAIALARRSRTIVAQNLTLAVGYNVVAMPLALTGVVTPLLAAVAMSVSSVLVIGNSLRLASPERCSSTFSMKRGTSNAWVVQ